MNRAIRSWSGIRRRLLNRRFWRDSSLLMLANVIVLILGLVRVPVLTRILSKDEVGMLGVVASVLPFMQILSMSGLDGASYHYVAQGYKAAFRVAFATRLRWSILSALGLLAVGAYWLWAGNQTLAWLFSIAALIFPLTTGLTAAAGTLGAREDFGRLFWYRIGEALTHYAGFGLLLLLPLMSTQVLWFSLANQAALAALQVGTAMWLIRQVRVDEVSPMLPEKQREMVRYGRHLTAINSISTAQTRVDALLIAWFLPLSVMADYSIAQLVYTQVKQLWTVYYAVRYPPLVRLPLARRRRWMVLEMGIIWAGFAALSLAVGAGLWVLVPIVLPSEYITSLPFINWLLAAFVVGIPGYFVEIYFRTCQNERGQYLLRGVAAVSGVALPSVFIIFWQAQGVVVGRFAASLVLSIFGAILYWKDGRKESLEA
ncbi:MAG: oligosaccharide flippase family protein [Chloroflexota bacterium]